jgi:type I restriction enzyme S subunit
MNAAHLLQHFQRVSEAPGAIPRLRRLILDLSLRGKLVEQDPKDEPAAGLLKRILAERARLIELGKVRVPRGAESMDHVEELYELPATWVWVRLSNVGMVVGGGTPPSSDLENFADSGTGVAWLTPADLGKHKGLFISHGARDLSLKGLAASSATLMPAGSVLFTSRAPIGYTAIASNPLTTNQGFKSVVPYFADLSRFSALYFRAFAPWIDSKASGTTFREVSGKIVAGLPFPLPPLAEQQRIVAKVDELMALCDQLEEAKDEREKSRDRLVTASLQRLNQPGDDEATFHEHARFTFKHLPRLTTRPAHIKHLRQTILNLAVRGKLVPQDPNDEPASLLLRGIADEKEKLVEEDLISKQKQYPEITEDEKLYVAPPGWQWVRLDILFNVIVDCPHSTPKFTGQGLVCIDTNCFKQGALIKSKFRYVNVDTYRDRVARITPNGGDIVFAREGSVGESVVLPEGLQCCLGQRVMLFRPSKRLNSEFLRMSISSPFSLEALLGLHKGIGAKHVNVADMRTFAIALPPAAEQHRIVAKVNELMALCDQLEAQLTAAETDCRRLLEAMLHEALSPALLEAA